ncbi:MAG: hypothetical protein M0Z70_11745 [Nitrospiraceae bacterium]|jgi:hypothetical protein|nr:hypothetical protein [Nitrospiraceae bacterium]
MTHSERLAERPEEILVSVFDLYYITEKDGKRRYICKLDGESFADKRDLERHVLNRFGRGYT